ncbi:hypothetical protein B0H34DRAFT_797326 [Crassisporium funariophilum]|nr:hypothetical protein B0H34DRAFT_797326 [Crassisporium funariophilum]
MPIFNLRTSSPKDIGPRGKIDVVPNSAAAPVVVFDSGWNYMSHPSATWTYTSGATAIIEFIGSSLSWIGLRQSEDFPDVAPATYSIDGGTPVNFTIAGLPHHTTTISNLTIFTTPQLPSGKHTLNVVYQGDGYSAPLYLVRLKVQLSNVDATTAHPPPKCSPSTDTSMSASFTNSPTPGLGPSSGKHSITLAPAKTIPGVVVGALAFIGMIILISMHLCKRLSQNQRNTITPFGVHSPQSLPRTRTERPRRISLAVTPFSLWRTVPRPRSAYGALQGITRKFRRGTANTFPVLRRSKFQREQTSVPLTSRRSGAAPSPTQPTLILPQLLDDSGIRFELVEMPPAYTSL